LKKSQIVFHFGHFFKHRNKDRNVPRIWDLSPFLGFHYDIIREATTDSWHHRTTSNSKAPSWRCNGGFQSTGAFVCEPGSIS
jgi:hypothetical protein